MLCFIVYLIPGLPKDIVCYLFGISPMPLWVFALVSGLGRIPGTWVLSAQGAHTAAGDYMQAILVTAVAVAAADQLAWRTLESYLSASRPRRAAAQKGLQSAGQTPSSGTTGPVA